jgi:methylmalonyl-CoA mutase
VIVGVNKYRLPTEEKVDVLSIDNKAVLASQLRRLERLRDSRDGQKVQEAMDRLTEAAKVCNDSVLLNL